MASIVLQAKRAVLVAVHTKPVTLAVAAAVQVRAELGSLLVTATLTATELAEGSLRTGRTLARHVVAGQAWLAVTGLTAAGAPGPRLAGQTTGGPVVAGGAVTGARDWVTPTTVLTLAALLTARAPPTRGTADLLTLSSAVAGLALALPGPHTLPVTTTLRTVGLAHQIVTAGLLVARATQPVGHSPADVLLPPAGLHAAHVVRADEGRGQTQRVLLDLD